MPQCRRYLVSGKVQGVFYRNSTRERAVTLGLTGWARNLQDGCVEVVACGEVAALDVLEQWLWVGPSRAMVRRVSSTVMEIETPAGFVTL